MLFLEADALKLLRLLHRCLTSAKQTRSMLKRMVTEQLASALLTMKLIRSRPRPTPLHRQSGNRPTNLAHHLALAEDCEAGALARIVLPMAEYPGGHKHRVWPVIACATTDAPNMATYCAFWECRLLSKCTAIQPCRGVDSYLKITVVVSSG